MQAVFAIFGFIVGAILGMVALILASAGTRHLASWDLEDRHRWILQVSGLAIIACGVVLGFLAYALAKLYRKDGTLTVIGGPHAKAFPNDCLRFFDLVVKDCDRRLIEEVLARRYDPPAIITSGRLLTEFPSVEERMPEIAAASFADGRPLFTSVVPMLASRGCPYSCDFCIDWSSEYVPLARDRVVADRRHSAEHMPNVHVVYHDPNFAVRFDEMMDIIEEVPAPRRSPYLMESSLSVLKPQRLSRLRATHCVYVASGVESWASYSSKAGVGDRTGREKLELVVDHFAKRREFVPGLQANFIFGTDEDMAASRSSSASGRAVRRDTDGVFAPYR